MRSSIHGVGIREIIGISVRVRPKIESCPAVCRITPAYTPCSLLFNKANHTSALNCHGVGSEIEEEGGEGGKFVPLNAEEPSYGPPAILLVGFRVDEADKIQQFLEELEGDFLQVIYCTQDMITRTLWEAVNIKQQSLTNLKIAKSVPRMCFLSGLTGEEMMMFIDAFEDAGLEPAVFAAHVPNSSSKTVGELIEEVMGDHEMLAQKS